MRFPCKEKEMSSILIGDSLIHKNEVKLGR